MLKDTLIIHGLDGLTDGQRQEILHHLEMDGWEIPKASFTQIISGDCGLIDSIWGDGAGLIHYRRVLTSSCQGRIKAWWVRKHGKSMPKITTYTGIEFLARKETAKQQKERESKEKHMTKIKANAPLPQEGDLIKVLHHKGGGVRDGDVLEVLNCRYTSEGASTIEMNFNILEAYNSEGDYIVDTRREQNWAKKSTYTWASRSDFDIVMNFKHTEKKKSWTLLSELNVGDTVEIWAERKWMSKSQQENYQRYLTQSNNDSGVITELKKGREFEAFTFHSVKVRWKDGYENIYPAGMLRVLKKVNTEVDLEGTINIGDKVQILDNNFGGWIEKEEIYTVVKITSLVGDEMKTAYLSDKADFILKNKEGELMSSWFGTVGVHIVLYHSSSKKESDDLVHAANTERAVAGDIIMPLKGSIFASRLHGQQCKVLMDHKGGEITVQIKADGYTLHAYHQTGVHPWDYTFVQKVSHDKTSIDKTGHACHPYSKTPKFLIFHPKTNKDGKEQMSIPKQSPKVWKGHRGGNVILSSRRSGTRVASFSTGR